MSTENKPSPEFIERLKVNSWETNLDVVVSFIKQAASDHCFWSWIKNSDCKYISLRIDMRDGGFVILDRNGNRISFEQLKWQYSEAPNERGK